MTLEELAHKLAREYNKEFAIMAGEDWDPEDPVCADMIADARWWINTVKQYLLYGS